MIALSIMVNSIAYSGALLFFFEINQYHFLSKADCNKSE